MKAENKTEIVLTLDYEEARVLYDFLGNCVFGSGVRREHTHRIWGGLDSLKILGPCSPPDMKGKVNLNN